MELIIVNDYATLELTKCPTKYFKQTHPGSGVYTKEKQPHTITFDFPGESFGRSFGAIEELIRYYHEIT